MAAAELTGVRSVLAAGLPPDLVARTRAVASDAVMTDGSVHDSVTELRNAVVSGRRPTAPDALVIGYAPSRAWSVRVLLSLALALPGGQGTRVLLVTEGPRSLLPVWLTDDSRLEVVAPSDVEARLRALLCEGPRMFDRSCHGRHAAPRLPPG